jgi:glycosyltransferase involved in cell wall biosynthesis
VRVVVLTTSYPRDADDVAGSFVRDGVEALRAAGVEVEVVSPASLPHFGIAYGGGIVQNLRARPWLLALLPAFLVSFALAARRAARGADAVHAHWLPTALPALATGRPFALQLWGTDVELARRAPRLARLLVRRAHVVIVASTFLERAARELGARDVRVIPNGVAVPQAVGAPAEPPHVLFAGRLSREKGIEDFVAATQGLPRVVAGDGPLRHLVPDALGFVPPSRLGAYYGRAAVVCVPSRREGFGVVAREALAHGRPVVATRAGGLPDAVRDGVNGLLVEPGDVPALRAALERLLGDAGLRERLGRAAREDARALSWDGFAEATLAAYRATASAATSRD